MVLQLLGFGGRTPNAAAAVAAGASAWTGLDWTGLGWTGLDSAAIT